MEKAMEIASNASAWDFGEFQEIVHLELLRFIEELPRFCAYKRLNQ